MCGDRMNSLAGTALYAGCDNFILGNGFVATASDVLPTNDRKNDHCNNETDCTALGKST